MNVLNHWGRSWFRHRATRLVGLDLGSNAIILIQLEKSGQKFSLIHFTCRCLARGVVQDGAILDRQRLGVELRNLVDECGLWGQPVVVAVSGPSVLLRRLQISGVQPCDLDKHLHWEGHRYVSLSLDDMCFDHQVLGVNEKGELDILLVVAKRELVEERQSLVSEAGLEPVGCDIAGLALANMASLSGFSTYASHLNVNLGSDGWTIVALDQGMPLFVREVHWEDDGTEDFMSLEMGGVGGGCGMPEAERFGEKVDRLDIQYMAREIRRNIDYMYEMGSAKKVEHILISGEGATRGLCEMLGSELSILVMLINPFHGISIRDSQINQDQAFRFESWAGVAIGLAARNDCII